MTVFLRLLLGIVMCASVFAPARVTAQAVCYVAPKEGNVNIRNGPGTEYYYVIGKLPFGQSLPATGRNGGWYAGTLPETDSAGVLGYAVKARGACGTLPVIPAPDLPPEITFLMDVPVLPTLDTDSLHAIFERGQTLGNDPAVFTTVGDCNTDTSYFLSAFDRSNYDLGPYETLQPTVDYFAGWFSHKSLAGEIGLNANMILDPNFADPSICLPKEGEGLLACEYRRERPAVAVMMFGINDLLNLNADLYTQALRQIVTLSIDAGVIPVLTTFTWHHDERYGQALAFNVITVEIAREYGVPLVNFWRAAQTLPDYGLMLDYTHLTDSGFPPGDYRIAFTGEEAFSGYALRNLLTLQTLDLLRREVLASG